jgi:predicted N-formylglutamate amidohydrolase
MALLGLGDPTPASVVGAGGRADVLLVGDHAGNAIPRSLGDLGLGETDRARHIAWDIGVRTLGARVANLLKATFVHQPFSRLVIDCNRDPQSADAILPLSDGTRVPANVGLDEESRAERGLAIHAPYHQRIADEIAIRHRASGPRPLLVAFHSFTPALGQESRPWHVGVLHDQGDTRASQAMLAYLRQEGDLTVGDNQPYRMDCTDYTVSRHAYTHALPYLELEFRNDLLAEERGQAWAVRCAAWIERVLLCRLG